MDVRMDVDDVIDIASSAAVVASLTDLARVLRALRRREALRRAGAELTYRQIANRTGWSVAVAGQYLTGVRLASLERFDELVRLLGADAAEQGALAGARERAAANRAVDTEGEFPAAVVPQMLPAPVVGFVGRSVQLAELDELLVASDRGETVVISALAGMGGVGKTALALHWAHRVAESFPDGQLYVDLRGYDPAEPLTPAQALGVLLAGLGVPPSSTPADAAGREDLYRRLLGSRKTLVVLDNAGGTDQVRPLLPPPSCLAVVTSRADLAELVTSCGGRGLSLGVLPEDEAVALLQPLIGPRADRERDAVRALARLCGYLPLALRVAAEQAAFRPAVSVADLVGELRTDRSPADHASSGLAGFQNDDDERVDVRTVLSWSLRRLTEPALRAFRLFGLVPGGEVDRYGLAALTGVDLATARRLTDTLVRVHLIQTDGRGRFSMHDLLRAYAIESAELELEACERLAATTRLLDYYLAVATVAVDLQFPLNRSTRPPSQAVTASTSMTPEINDVAAASAWLTTERASLVPACVHAARQGWPRHAIALALVLRPFLDDGHYQDGLIVQTEALAAARLLGDACDPADRASIHGCLGITNWWLGRLDVAAAELQYALAENLRLGNAGGATVNIAVLGLVRDAQGRFQEAIQCQQRGLDIARAAGIRTQEGCQLINLGYINLRLEHYDVAADLYRQAYDIFEHGDEVSAMAHARYCLATALQGLGRYGEALSQAEQALAIMDSFGHLINRIRVLETIGSLYRHMGQAAEATLHLTTALRLCRDAYNARPTSHVLNTLGETVRQAGDFARALAHHREALDLAERSGDRFEKVRAVVGLGDAHAGLGDTEQAACYWRQALHAYTEMNLPAADRVRARLSMSGR
jgi:tetratricopeptide (TPR) repeat protein